MRWPLLGVGLMVSVVAWAASASRGETIYNGSAQLPARVAGHSQDLPHSATACANCHAGNTTADAANAAPSIIAGALARVQSRRNGPPGAYDATRLCHALRSGTDPLQIRLPTRMPRYDIRDDDCEALWLFLNPSTP